MNFKKLFVIFQNTSERRRLEIFQVLFLYSTATRRRYNTLNVPQTLRNFEYTFHIYN